MNLKIKIIIQRLAFKLHKMIKVTNIIRITGMIKITQITKSIKIAKILWTLNFTRITQEFVEI